MWNFSNGALSIVCTSSCTDSDNIAIANWYTENCGSDNGVSEHFLEAKSSAATATNHASPTPSATGRALSTGAKVGIGVSVSVAGIALICLAFWAYFRRRRNTQEIGEQNNYDKPELMGKGAEKAGTADQTVELAPDDVGEMEGLGRRGELHGSGRYELPSEWQGYEVGDTRTRSAETEHVGNSE